MIKPIRKKIVFVRQQAEFKTDSGLILDMAVTDEYQTGKVVAVGPEVTEIKIGDIILPQWNMVREASYDGQNYSIVEEDAVIGVLE